MSSFSFWQTWLFVVGLVIAVFGIVMALVSGTPLFDAFSRQIDPAFWGASVVDDSARRFQQWIYGVWGATIAGWGVFVAYVSRYPFSRKEKWAWNCTFLGLAVWFILDTLLSAFHAVYFNVLFNIIILVLAMLPVILTRREFS